MNIWKSHIHHFHLDHNAPHLLLNILHSHCFQFFLGITVVPREIEDNGYAKFWGGKQGSLWSMWEWWISNCSLKKWMKEGRLSYRCQACRQVEPLIFVLPMQHSTNWE